MPVKIHRGSRTSVPRHFLAIRAGQKANLVGKSVLLSRGNYHGRARLVISRTLLLAELVVGIALAIGCGRTDMGTLARVSTGSGGTDATVGDAGGAASGPCAEVPCLASLFQTCVPEGSCTVKGGASPSASFNTGCYSNGVTVSYMASYSGSNLTGSLNVRRDGVLCYSIDTSSPIDSNANTYVVRDPNGEEVATGALVDKSGSVTVTCNGGKPTPVSGACLRPVGDNSACDSGPCP